jgi:hypothetical protein
MEVSEMSNDELFHHVAKYNLELRRGRRMVKEGDNIIKENINHYVACQNELMSRMTNRIEGDTDNLEEGDG